MPERWLPEDERAVEGVDVQPLRVLIAAGGILLALMLVVLAVGALLRVWNLPFDLGPNTPRDFRPDAPRLLSAPQQERATYFAEQARRLHSYGWVDREAGTAHIPIEVAMMLLAAREKAGVPPERERGGGR